jgi:N-acetylmuramoyl-L-alanine amidase
MKISRQTIPAALVALSIFLGMSLEPALRAARGEERDPSLGERIFAAAAEAERQLHAREFEERGPGEYPRVIDLYRQVTEASEGALADRARIRMAGLTREMALRTGDASQFAEAIDVYRKLVIASPDSPYIGEALVAIAEVYEYDLQDIDGAAGAFREIVRRFPDSVAGREAAANLARLDGSAAGGAPSASVIGTIAAPGSETAYLAEAGQPAARVVNVRSFAGPSYARVVVDLNRPVSWVERRAGTRVSYRLPGVELSQSLLGRRLSTPRESLLRAMRVEQLGDGVVITLDLAALKSSSAFALEDPARLIIDLRGAGATGSAASKDAPAGAPADLVGETLAELAPAPARPEGLPAPPAPELAPGAPPSGGPRMVRCIVIDAGHGGQDTGTIGPGGLAEKDVTLDIARRLRASLRAELPGVRIVMTRDGDRFVSLEERTATANANDADLFISVHANASQSSSASGIETFVADPEALRAVREEQARRSNQLFASVSFASQVAESRSLARFVQGSLVRGVSAKSPKSAKDRGIKHASFAVLRGARMPSILAEVSFVSNPEDENRLRTPGFRQRIASSLTAGVRAYVRSVAG